jgi:protein-disulfide isomerase
VHIPCRDEAYRHWFIDHDEAGSDKIGAHYSTATDLSRKLGIFGAPTFVVRNKLFWAMTVLTTPSPGISV